jgi:acetyl esterase
MWAMQAAGASDMGGTLAQNGLEPESAALLRQLQAGNTEVLDHNDVTQLRLKMASFMKSCGPTGLPVKTATRRALRFKDREIGTMQYRPLEKEGEPATQGAPLPILVYFHGGAFTHFSADTHDAVARYLCNKAGCVVVSVDYRLAPEHKFPAALDDAYDAVSWVAEHAGELGGDPHKIAVAGESAGGTISIAVCLMSKDRGGPRIALQIPMCPSLTLHELDRYASWQVLGGGEYLLSKSSIEDIKALYLPRWQDSLNPLASPILARDLTGLPPALIVTAQFDPLVDEAAHYGQRLQEAGVPLTYRCFEGTVHSFMIMAGAISLGYTALDLVAARIASL